MSDLNVELLPWQQEVFNATERFKVVAAGRRCGKSRLAAWMLIINALQSNVVMSFMLLLHKDRLETLCGVCC
jgi:hypothetical protein